MGKMRKKARLHAAAPKTTSQKSSGEGSAEVAMDIGTSDSKQGAASIVDGGVFSKLDIDINALQSRLPDDLENCDARSSLTNKTFKEFNLTKKEKLRLKHHLWLKKVDALKEAKKQSAAKRRREKTAVVGDMKLLEDTLPTLDLLLRETSDKPQRSLESKEKTIKSEKVRKKQMMEGCSLFQQVASHPVFRENPLATIREHLQNKLKQEESQRHDKQ